MIRTVLRFAAFATCITLFAQPAQNGAPKLGGLSGTVTEAKSGAPVRKALVILRNDPNPPTGTYTDNEGKFTLRDIAPGGYIVSAQKDGWVPAQKNETQTVAVVAGETASAEITMQRTGAISGRVVDAEGEPLPGVGIQVVPVPERRNGRPGSWASTNDRGEYRAFNIAPGQYRVCATYSQQSQQLELRLQTPAAAGSRATAAAYPQVCYPGSLSPSQATVVTVEPATDMQAIDLQIVPARAVNVRGRVISQAAQKPMFMMVMLQAADRSGAAGGTPEAIVRDPEGKFELRGVLPGRYRLTVQGAGLGGETRLSASRAIEVADTDVEGIDLVLGAPRKLDGRVIVPEGRKVPSLMVILASRDPGDRQAGGITQVQSNGVFSFPEVGTGEYDVILGSNGPGDDLYVSAIRMGDADALADGVRVDNPASLEIILKANGGTLNCSVLDDKEKPVPGGVVALLPDPPREHQSALMGDCRTDAKGSCTIMGITPGEYHAYAFHAGIEVDQRDPDALKPYEKFSKSVKFAEGDRKDVQLRAATPE